ncbi:MAG: NADH-quinone oxidoreductase subunit G [Sulfurimonas sp.]|uniref:NADH-quinone oxidoreductase subunit G n=1 Tax=Sulfurimonas sp. TaxID=2022749 RepID=UPI00262678ED|nr:NADH-quinone oxidoreductase subunit G [Sulfurimonas sp.]MCW8895691.1 NADH-quinone oxidoreductase subunit G [Sulfurimonas sp.]MCW8955037.1 NADH-quinone oxidoreductase subunit G [Sulfurimonas sp.]MCW9067941.1 NADH-quinone oxidoreductase subunit G [Sulfurimonas sp.]
MDKIINFKINGISVEAQKGETILTVARKNDIYIPTMCYISKTTPCASCRMCVVEASGVEGFVLSCNTPPTEGIEITTNNAELENERINIMKLYDVNHPLECGVCDKSGECDLQNKTLEFDIQKQNFSARDQARPIQQWGLINYDPALCILCEKCVHVCNEVIGDDAIEVKFGGYSSVIIPKNADTLDCTFCGECIAVCPVGALISSDFQYKANSWELSRVPATCAHCSAGCSLEYETRHMGINGADELYRVKNNFEFTSLCGAGRFGFDFDNKATKDDAAFHKAVEALKNAAAIRFSSIITNEEAHILQLLKEKLGIKLFNEDARKFAEFMKSYSSVSGKLHHSGSLDAIKQSDAAIILGSRIATDNPGVRYALTTAARHNGAKIVYAHPMEDVLMQNVTTQMMKYEVGTEEGVIALLASAILSDADLDESEKAFFDDLDLGYIYAETNLGEEEFSLMMKSFSRAKNRVLIVGNDLIAHERSDNIAKLVALIEKYSDFSIVVVPREVNTLGVSLINTLDIDEDIIDVVGYNDNGNFVISSLEYANLSVPALNQQEGTVVSIDNRVLPTNAALGFDGYNLNDLANALGIHKKNTIDYTKELNTNAGFKDIEFDNLENFLSKMGDDVRGYLLDEVTCQADGQLEELDDLPEFNGTIIYHADPVLQFNAYTNKTKQLEKDNFLRGSAQFSVAAKISDGDIVDITFGSTTIQREFKLDSELKGTIALNPTFDINVDPSRYRFEKSKIVRVM